MSVSGIVGNSYGSYYKMQYPKQKEEVKHPEASEFFENIKEKEATEDQDSKADTNSNIVVKSDGSRVLVVTATIGEMVSTMSIQISKPTGLISGLQKELTEARDDENGKAGKTGEVSETGEYIFSVKGLMGGEE